MGVMGITIPTLDEENPPSFYLSASHPCPNPITPKHLLYGRRDVV